MTKRSLTVLQEAFLEHLFGDAKGNPVKAKVMAGYDPASSTKTIMNSVSDHIVERTRQFLAENGPKAAVSLVDVMDNPSILGVAYKLSAAKDVLDRIGISKTEKVELSSNGVFLLPPKDEN